jgi:hypothetical protein
VSLALASLRIEDLARSTEAEGFILIAILQLV